MEPRVERLYREVDDDRRRTEAEIALAIRAEFFRAPTFNYAIKGLVAYLLTFEDRGEALPTVRQAAADGKMTERSMTSYFSQLKQYGILTVVRSYGAGGTQYEPINLAAVLSDDQIRHILRPVANLNDRRTPKQISGIPAKNPETNFGNSPGTPENNFRKPIPESNFRNSPLSNDEANSTPSRRRFLIKTTTETTNSGETQAPNTESNFVNPSSGNPERNFGDTRTQNTENTFGMADGLRVAREDEAAIRPLFDHLCELAGPVSFSKLHPTHTVETLHELINIFSHLTSAKVRDPKTWTRHALEKGWTPNVYQKAAKQRNERRETAQVREQQERVLREAETQESEARDRAVLDMYESATEGQRTEIEERAVRYAYRVVGRRLELDSPFIGPYLRRAIREVLLGEEERS